MKTRKHALGLLMLSALTFATITSCGGGSSTPSINFNEGVEIGGPSTVAVGKQIKLIADVVNSDDDTVIWSSSDQGIATVDSNGNVTGISAGKVTITAKNAADPQYFGEKEITVTQDRATDIYLSIVDGSEAIKITDTYYLLSIGDEVTVKLTTNDGAKLPDYINFETILPSDAHSSTVNLKVDENDPTIAKLSGFAEISNLVLKATANYKDYSGSSMIASITFDIVDPEEVNKTTVLASIATFAGVEAKSLVSSKINKSIKYKYADSAVDSENNHILNKDERESIIHNSYIDASYSFSTINNYDEGKAPSTYEKNIYNGIYDSKAGKKYYLFSYDSDNIIQKLYENKNASSSDINQNYVVDDSFGYLTYGHNEFIESLFTAGESIHGDIITFANPYAYAYAEFTLTDSKHSVTSTFTNPDTNINYTLSLDINYDKDLLTSYSFKETVTSDILTIEYVYEATDLVYGDKVADTTENNEKHLNIDSYYLEDFDINETNEKTEHYNYSDKNKYGADRVETTDEGLTKYILPINKTLVLKVSNTGSNKNASFAIDRIVAKSSDTEQIPDVELTGNEIFAINAKTDKHGKAYTGLATFTFTSTLGVSKSVVVEFVEYSIKGVYVSGIDNNDLGEIYTLSNSDYFYINTDPDEDIYEYYINVIEGDKDGIELFRWDYDNIYGNPGFSYSISAKVAGTYKFKVGIVGYGIETEETYTLKVIPHLTNDELEDIFVNSGNEYIYDTGTMQVSLTFNSSTQLTLSTKMLSADPVSCTVNYHFEDGKLFIDDEYQTLATGMYFGKIKGGETVISKDFTQIKLFFTQEADGASSNSYAGYTFRLHADLSDVPGYIDGKTFETSVFLRGHGTLDASLSFKAGAGEFEIIKNGETFIKYTFNYEYNEPATTLYLSDMVGVVETSPYYLDDEIYVNTNSNEFEVKLYDATYYTKLTFLA